MASTHLHVIRHWLAEVQAFRESLDRAKKRLGSE
jgi:hypothetical protein